MTVLIWQEGHGSELLFDQAASGTITTCVPIAAFAFLFGLSMNYEVFILSRMREAYDQHGDTPRAVVDGIGHTVGADPSFSGDSVGHWEGDTLVVETNNLRAGTLDRNSLERQWKKC